jgi:DNA primase
MAERGDIDRVRESTDLVELISEVTKVKRSGRNYMAVCPFHEEKTPSMSVDRARGLYNCFGCGKNGDVFTFVEETQGLDFRDALELLARRAGITLVRDPVDAQRRGRRGAAVEVLRRAVDVYHTRLKKASDAGLARAYLRNRGYDVDIIDEWKLGFAGTDWDTLTKELRAAGAEERVLVDAGVSRKGRHGLYDVFRGRLMFPIHDLRGDPVGFGGRRIEEVDESATNNPDAKYVNSADSIVYHKAQVLFGLDRARAEISEESPAVIVEGYTDVIAMHLAGIKTAVATCGTALGEGHFDLLRRFSPAVVLCFDPDDAGSRAALRGGDVNSKYRSDVDLLYAAMPDGLDPADLVQSGRADELGSALENVVPLLEHRIRHEVAKHWSGSPESQDRALRAAAVHIAQVDKSVNPLAWDRYVELLSRLVGPVERETVESVVQRQKGPRAPDAPPTGRPLDRLEAELIRFLVSHPDRIGEFTAEDFGDPRLAAAFGALAHPWPSGEVNLLEVTDEGSRSLLFSLTMEDRPLSPAEEISGRIKERRLDRQIDTLERELSEMVPGTQDHSDNLRRLIALQQEKRSPTEP